MYEQTAILTRKKPLKESGNQPIYYVYAISALTAMELLTLLGKRTQI